MSAVGIGQEWRRVTSASPCPVCSKDSWCTIAPDGSAARCKRSPSEHASPGEDGDAWIHELRPGVRIPPPQSRREDHSGQDWAAIAREQHARITNEQVATLARQLGVDSIALRELGIGWDGDCWTFPMFAADGSVCGIRRRPRKGNKHCVTGSKLGVFRRLQPDEGQLLITEGESDAAAAITLMQDAIGIPGTGQCCDIAAAYARGRDVVIVPDADKPGQDGARKLIAALVGKAKSVRLLTPPAPLKDLRDWLRGTEVVPKLTPASLATVIEAATPIEADDPDSASSGTQTSGGAAGADEDPGSTAAHRAPVEIDKRPFHELLTRAVHLLARRTDVAVQGGVLVHVAADDRGGPPRVRVAPRGLIREWLSLGARWATGSGKEQTEVHPPAAVVEALSESRLAWPGIPYLPHDDVPTRDAEAVALDPPIEWIAEPLLAASTIEILAGPPNSGKSLLVIDLAKRLQCGMASWLGVPLRSGGASTLYLVAEGLGGIGARLRAWAVAHPGERPVGDHYFAVRGAVPNLAADNAADVLREIVDDVARQHGGRIPDIVVIDTLSAAMPGTDENDTAASSAAAHALSTLQRAYGCCIVLLHHVRKPPQQAAGRRSGPPPEPTLADIRSHSPVVGKCDIAMIATGNAIHVVKNRDGGGKGEPIGYAVVGQPTGRGHETSAIVLAAAPAAPTPEAAPTVDPSQQALTQVREVVEALRQLGGRTTSVRSVTRRCKGGTPKELEAAFREAIDCGEIDERKVRGIRIYTIAITANAPCEGAQTGGVCTPHTPLSAPAPYSGGGASGGGKGAAPPSAPPSDRPREAKQPRQHITASPDDGLPEQPRRRRKAKAGGA